MDRTVVALYDDLTSAQKAVESLVDEGFPRSNISLLANDATNEYAQYLKAPAVKTATTKDAVTAGQGASFGTVVGALTGIVVGLGALTIPGVGPIIAAGPLATGLGVLGTAAVGAGAGAITGGVTAALVKTGVSEREAEYYTEGVRRGGTLVVVHTNDQQIASAERIINNYGPVDIQQRANAWQQHDWKGYSPDAEAYTAEEISKFRSTKY